MYPNKDDLLKEKKKVMHFVIKLLWGALGISAWPDPNHVFMRHGEEVCLYTRSSTSKYLDVIDNY